MTTSIRCTSDKAKGGGFSQKHNRRDKKTIERERERELRLGIEPHIKDNENYVIIQDIDIKEAYEALFEDAIEDYNKKVESHGHKERRIESAEAYYNKIKNDPDKRTSYEIIVQVGSKEDTADEETLMNIYNDYLQGWLKEYPNLKIIGAYYHGDETTPHLHIDYIPIAEKNQRGMACQVSQKGAFREMGIEGTGRQDTAQMVWQRMEYDRLNEICEGYGLEIKNPQSHKAHTDQRVYHNQNMIEEQNKRLAEANTRLTELKWLTKGQREIYEDLQKESDEKRADIEELKEQKEGIVSDIVQVLNEYEVDTALSRIEKRVAQVEQIKAKDDSYGMDLF